VPGIKNTKNPDCLDTIRAKRANFLKRKQKFHRKIAGADTHPDHGAGQSGQYCIKDTS